MHSYPLRSARKRAKAMPPEILALIIEQDNCAEALCSWALVCSATRILAQERLFLTVAFFSTEALQRAVLFLNVLKSSRRLGGYVRALSVPLTPYFVRRFRKSWLAVFEGLVKHCPRITHLDLTLRSCPFLGDSLRDVL